MQLRLLIQTNEDLIYKGLFRILISTQTIFDLFGKKELQYKHNNEKNYTLSQNSNFICSPLQKKIEMLGKAVHYTCL